MQKPVHRDRKNCQINCHAMLDPLILGECIETIDRHKSRRWSEENF